jgi:hypothetical protein
MYGSGGRRRGFAASGSRAVLALGACAHQPATGSGEPDGGPGSGMMGGGGYRSSSPTCSVPDSLPGTRVQVWLMDMGMSTRMGGVAPMGAPMRLRLSTGHVSAGTVTLVVHNVGWRTHELVVLPLGRGVPAGQRSVGADGRVSEAGSLGEASRSCGPDEGDGITSGSAGWTTITLPGGRYELV